MGRRISQSGNAAKPAENNSLLKLLDDLYIGGMPGLSPAPKDIDAMKMPAKKILNAPLVEEEEDDESIDIPNNITGSY